MFGVSFLEIALVGLVALIVVGPQKLPGMMRTAGEWVGKLRRLTADMRAQTGIDDILREEGIDGVAELRTLLKGERAMAARRSQVTSGYEAYSSDPDPAVEFPVEGPDASGALPDDLLDEVEPSPQPVEAKAPAPKAAPPAKDSKKSPAPAAPTRTNAPPSSRPPPPRPAPATKKSSPGSIPPPPATPRRSPPRAVTHPETPLSKSEPKITISEPPAPRTAPKPPAKSGSN